MPFCLPTGGIYPARKEITMDPTSLYETYTNAVADGKLEVLKMFVDTLMAHPFQAAFYGWLLFRKPSKTFNAFIDRFL